MRKFGITVMSAAILLGVLAVIASVEEPWLLVIICLVGLILLTIGAVFVASRHSTHLARTQERKIGRNFQYLIEISQLNTQAIELMSKNQNKMLNSIRAIDSEHTRFHSESAAVTERKIDHLEDVNRRLAQSSANHISATVRHGTSEIESLLQIFSQIEGLGFPMPGSGGWAIDAQGLAHIISEVKEKRPRRILELGSGSSTVWLGHLCRSYGGKLFTLDHLDEYLDKTRALINRHALADHIDTRLAPLEEVMCDGENFRWYSLDSFEDLTNIDMLIVDGPPEATGPKARYPALPMIIDRLAPEATVILDDAHRAGESEIIDKWLAEYTDFSRIDVGVPGIAILERNAQHDEQ